MRLCAKGREARLLNREGREHLFQRVEKVEDRTLRTEGCGTQILPYG
jgi:hypothetical protein